MLDAGAIGRVTTHDLALAEIAEELAPVAAKVQPACIRGSRLGAFTGILCDLSARICGGGERSSMAAPGPRIHSK